MSNELDIVDDFFCGKNIYFIHIVVLATNLQYIEGFSSVIISVIVRRYCCSNIKIKVLCFIDASKVKKKQFSQKNKRCTRVIIDSLKHT